LCLFILKLTQLGISESVEVLMQVNLILIIWLSLMTIRLQQFSRSHEVLLLSLQKYLLLKAVNVSLNLEGLWDTHTISYLNMVVCLR